MKKVLFVVGGRGIGGIISSLRAILHSDLIKHNDIKVFFMSTISGEDISSDINHFVVKNNNLSQLLFSSTRTLSFFDRIPSLLIKLLFLMGKLGEVVRESLTRKIIRDIEKENYDCVIAFSEGLPLRFVSEFKCPNKCVWIHCDYAKGISSKPIERAIYSRYRRIVCVSEATRKSFASVYPELEERTCFIYNLVDVKDIQSRAMAPIDDSRFIHNRFTIVSIGRIVPVKRFALIPQIAKQLLRMGLLFKWYIIGDSIDDKEKQKLKKTISDSELHNIVVCTSSSEACPMIFLEAKVLGIPIVTTKFDSAKEFIVSEADGRVCELSEIANCIYYYKQYPNIGHINTPDIYSKNDYIISQINQLIDA